MNRDSEASQHEGHKTTKCFTHENPLSRLPCVPEWDEDQILGNASNLCLTPPLPQGLVPDPVLPTLHMLFPPPGLLPPSPHTPTSELSQHQCFRGAFPKIPEAPLPSRPASSAPLPSLLVTQLLAPQCLHYVISVTPPTAPSGCTLALIFRNLF